MAFKRKTIALLQKLYIIHKRKLPKLTSKMLVSFVNEAPEILSHSLAFGRVRYYVGQRKLTALVNITPK
jgi:hypothetical protein